MVGGARLGPRLPRGAVVVQGTAHGSLKHSCVKRQTGLYPCTTTSMMIGYGAPIVGGSSSVLGLSQAG